MIIWVYHIKIKCCDRTSLLLVLDITYKQLPFQSKQHCFVLKEGLTFFGIVVCLLYEASFSFQFILSKLQYLYWIRNENREKVVDWRNGKQASYSDVSLHSTILAVYIFNSYFNTTIRSIMQWFFFMTTNKQVYQRERE